MVPSDILMLPAKGEDIILKSVTKDKNNQWLVATRLQAIGSDQKRECRKHFTSMVEAKQHFEKETSKYRKMLERITNITISQKEAELLITKNGCLVVHLAITPESRDCA